MNSKRVHLIGQEHLPPILREFTDPSFKYSAHKHTVEHTKDGLLHTYSVIVSQRPLNESPSDDDVSTEMTSLLNGVSKKTDTSKSNENVSLISQIKSTTTSEMAELMKKKGAVATESTNSSSTCSLPVQRESQYMNLSDVSEIASDPLASTKILRAKVRPKEEDSHYTIIPSTEKPPSPVYQNPGFFKCCSSSSDDSSVISTKIMSSHTNSSLPEFTYSSASVKGDRPVKFVMMVHVKFLFLHRDVFNKRAQSMFSDEFPSTITLGDLIYNFQQLCRSQLRGNDFKPRLSYCFGDLHPNNSYPVHRTDLSKTLTQLANSNSVPQFSLIVNNLD